MAARSEFEAELFQKELYSRNPIRLEPLLFSGTDFERMQTYWWRGEDKEEYPEIPNSLPTERPPMRFGVKPKVLMPGEWAGYDYHYQDTLIELPQIDANSLVKPIYNEDNDIYRM
jgi:hypothetical protein